MERSRSKRYYYDQDYEHESLHSRSKPRYSKNSHGGGSSGGQHYGNSYHQRRSYNRGGGGDGGGGRKMQDSLMVTTSYRILCHDALVGGVIGKSGSIINSIRQHTGAWINVQELVQGDEVRIIEISDTRRRDPDGRMPAFSPAQEALFMIHDRILETEMGGGGFVNGPREDENEEHGSRRGGGFGNKVVTKLVVSKIHVGCLLGKGGKIIEQMRMETKTHIRVLPRDHALPRCIDMADEIVQVVGDLNAVKDALAIISSRLRESQHRDRSHILNRQHSPDRLFPDNNFRSNNRRSSAKGPAFGSRYSGGSLHSYSSCPSGYADDSGPAPVSDNAQSFSGEPLVFRMLCAVNKIDTVIGESDGIVDLLQNEIGVNVDVTDPVAGLDEYVIIISSDEGPDDELFPAQEALLHIQTRIVDLVLEKENIITTRLLLQSDEVECLGLNDGSLEQGEIGDVNIKVMPREDLPVGVSAEDEIVQIIGEIKAARQALVEVTNRLRNYIYGGFLEKGAQAPDASGPNNVDNAVKPETTSKNGSPSLVNGSVVSTNQTASIAVASSQKMKDVGPRIGETVKQNKNEQNEDQSSGLNSATRMSVPLVTRSTLEIVIPPRTAAALATKSRKLIFISELSGASIKLIEDDKPEATEKIIQISGTPEQTDKAQSLLQGYILSTEEDGP